MKKRLFLVALAMAGITYTTTFAQKEGHAKSHESEKSTHAKSEDEAASPRGQQHRTPEQQADATVRRMKEKIGISESQASQAKTIALAMFQELEAHKATKPVRADKEAHKAFREKREVIFNAANTKMLAILTAEQAAKYKEMQSDGKK